MEGFFLCFYIVNNFSAFGDRDRSIKDSEGDRKLGLQTKKHSSFLKGAKLNSRVLKFSICTRATETLAMPLITATIKSKLLE